MRTSKIAHRYRIGKSRMRADFHGELHRYNIQFYHAIRLDNYYSLLPEVFYKDLPLIERIHTYLTNFGFPKDPFPAPERSAEVVGDEKWIIQWHTPIYISFMFGTLMLVFLFILYFGLPIIGIEISALTAAS